MYTSPFFIRASQLGGNPRITRREINTWIQNLAGMPLHVDMLYKGNTLYR